MEFWRYFSSINKSISNKYILEYYNIQKNGIECYNILKNKKIISILNAHKKKNWIIKIYLDKIKNQDLLLTCSCDDNCIKLWNCKNF